MREERDKSFDQKEHDIYDPLGKNAMLSILKKKFPQYEHIENPNRYGIDVLTLNKNNKVIACWEVEVRHGNWQGNIPFPFSDINCLDRKDEQWLKEPKFLNNIPFEMADNYKVHYVQMNKECTRAVVIEGDTVLKYPLKEWKNRKAVKENKTEYVRQVPISDTKQIKLV